MLGIFQFDQNKLGVIIVGKGYVLDCYYYGKDILFCLQIIGDGVLEFVWGVEYLYFYCRMVLWERG